MIQPIAGEPFLTALRIVPAPTGQSVRFEAMTEAGLVARHPYDDHGLVAAKAAIRDHPHTASAWDELGVAFRQQGYGEAALWAWKRAAQYGSAADVQHQLQRDRLQAGARLLMSTSDHSEYIHQVLVLRHFGNTLPLYWLAQFHGARFGRLWVSIFVESHDRVFDPQSDLLVKGGLISCSPSEPTLGSAQQAELDTLLGHLMATDPDAAIEERKARVREIPFQSDRWDNLIRALHESGRHALATLCAKHARSVFADEYQVQDHTEDLVDRIQSAATTGPCRVLHDPDRLHRLAAVYFSRLRALSDPPEQSRFDEINVDYPCNESTYLGACAEGPLTIFGRGGAYIGTGAGLFLPHMVHQRASIGYVVDYNRFVTEALMPATGLLLASAEDPAEWLSWLLAVPLTSAERADLASQDVVEYRHFFADRDSDERWFVAVMADLCRLLRPHFPTQEWERCTNALIRFAYREWYVQSAVSASFHRGALLSRLSAQSPTGYGGILSHRENFGAAQRLWQEGRITGVSADWQGGVMGHIRAELRARGERVQVIYPSNILDYSMSRGAWQGMHSALTDLQAEADGVVIQMELGGALMKRYRYDAYLRMITCDSAHPSEAWQPIQFCMRALAHMWGTPQEFFARRLSGSDNELEALRRYPLIKSLLELAADEPPQLTTAAAKALAQRHRLSPNDTWRLLFFLRDMGCLAD